MNQKKAKQLRAALKDKLESVGTKHLDKLAYTKLKFKTVQATAAFNIWKKQYNEAKRRYAMAPTFLRKKVGEEWREAGYACG